MARRNQPRSIVVLAHTPPPVHGQSLMVSLMLDAFRQSTGGHSAPRIFHVDCRYSDGIKSMGRAQIHKFFLAIRYAVKTLAIRFRHGVTTLYYVPAPGKHPAFLRDCLVLSLVRPFFSKVIFQWHAAGLEHWLETRAWSFERWMARRIYRDHSLSIVQLEEKASEAAYFHPRAIQVIPYGIPDPCPNFDTLPSREMASPNAPVRLLYLSIATREKGVFSAVEVWRRLNQRASREGRAGYHLTIAGEFPTLEEEKEFLDFLKEARETVAAEAPTAEQQGCTVEVIGPVHHERKSSAYLNADIFIFPSTYPWESFGVVLVEAAHFGLPCVTFQPLVGPTGLSLDYHRRVPFGDIDAFTAAVASVSLEHSSEIRADALAKFNADIFGKRMRAACLGIDSP